MGKLDLHTGPPAVGQSDDEQGNGKCRECGHDRMGSASGYNWLRRVLRMQPAAARCGNYEVDEAGMTSACLCRNLAHGS